MQAGSSGTLIGWESGQTTFVPLWDRMEGAWLRTYGKRLHLAAHPINDSQNVIASIRRHGGGGGQPG